jgi:signal transduction histidine kinase
MRRGHWVALDFVAGAFFGLINAAALIAGEKQAAPIGPLGTHDRAAFLLGGLIVGGGVMLAVGLRRYQPQLVLALLMAASIMEHLLLAGGPGLFMLYLPTTYVLFYVVTTFENRRAQAATLALVLCTFAVNVVFWVQVSGVVGAIPQSVGYGLFLAIAWAGGYIVRQRRSYAVGLQVEAASKAVAEERLRIARELHDVVAHSMSVIAVQAGYGQYVMDAQPDDARTALSAIQATSRDALDEMRRMLGALRQADYTGPASPAATQAAGAAEPAATDRASEEEVASAANGYAAAAGAPGVWTGAPVPPTSMPGARDGAGTATDGETDQDRAGFARVLRQMMRSEVTEPATAARASTANAPLYPAPGLADLDRLIARTQGAGIEVRLARHGEPRELPAGVDLSAYRIIQEALTNVVKHAHTKACDVFIGYGSDELVLKVTDGGAGVTVPSSRPRYAEKWESSGHGITGMRERVSLLGGEFRAGPLPGYGFQVSVRIPV